MAFKPWQPPALRPASVAIHDDGDVRRGAARGRDDCVIAEGGHARLDELRLNLHDFLFLACKQGVDVTNGIVRGLLNLGLVTLFVVLAYRVFL